MITQIQNDKPKCKKMTKKQKHKIIILEFPMFAGPKFPKIIDHFIKLPSAQDLLLSLPRVTSPVPFRTSVFVAVGTRQDTTVDWVM
jgi:hypothetical protein